jgi:vacuolar iron transporter family protein
MEKHFENKSALAHVMQKRVEGMVSVSESHGTEMPGYLSAASDAGKETALVLLLFWLILSILPIPFSLFFLSFCAFGLGYVAWKTGRSGWLGWAKLERLHRLIEQERYEISHHRPQEREELRALYRAKGFEGRLLEEILDVLMADQDRLLKVMLEEEMGLTLQAYEHPLQQTIGAAVGALLALLVCGFAFFFFHQYGIVSAALLLIGSTSALSALYEKNRVIPAVIWNLGVAALAYGIVHYLLKL